jgi:hypothetical protein
MSGSLERETGFEPATSSLGSWHSTPELLPLQRMRFKGCLEELSRKTRVNPHRQNVKPKISTVGHVTLTTLHPKFQQLTIHSRVLDIDK